MLSSKCKREEKMVRRDAPYKRRKGGGNREAGRGGKIFFIDNLYKCTI
jgi:hypothetical protein